MEVERFFAAFAVVVELEGGGALGGEKFGVDDVTELEWKSMEGGRVHGGGHV